MQIDFQRNNNTQTQTIIASPSKLRASICPTLITFKQSYANDFVASLRLSSKIAPLYALRVRVCLHRLAEMHAFCIYIYLYGWRKRLKIRVADWARSPSFWLKFASKGDERRESFLDSLKERAQPVIGFDSMGFWLNRAESVVALVMGCIELKQFFEIVYNR